MGQSQIFQEFVKIHQNIKNDRTKQREKKKMASSGEKRERLQDTENGQPMRKKNQKQLCEELLNKQHQYPGICVANCINLQFYDVPFLSGVHENLVNVACLLPGAGDNAYDLLQSYLTTKSMQKLAITNLRSHFPDVDLTASAPDFLQWRLLSLVEQGDSIALDQILSSSVACSINLSPVLESAIRLAFTSENGLKSVEWDIVQNLVRYQRLNHSEIMPIHKMIHLHPWHFDWFPRAGGRPPVNVPVLKRLLYMGVFDLNDGPTRKLLADCRVYVDYGEGACALKIVERHFKEIVVEMLKSHLPIEIVKAIVDFSV